MAYCLEAPPLWPYICHPDSFQKYSTTSESSATITWGPSVQTHYPVGHISHWNHTFSRYSQNLWIINQRSKYKTWHYERATEEKCCKHRCGWCCFKYNFKILPAKLDKRYHKKSKRLLLYRKGNAQCSAETAEQSQRLQTIQKGIYKIRI